MEHSRLFGYWYSEFGLLNQALHIWPYDDLQQRTEVREEVNGIDFWPPATADLLTAQNTEIYFPAPFNDEAITGIMVLIMSCAHIPMRQVIHQK
ncbi:MAG: hypothetical protein CM1200mP39_00320 [Dehalococcoidia bacterium]|nr:MAG: hypothetical protein CM1200mP39_00320 [Dehalococcoidia bacterium]